MLIEDIFHISGSVFFLLTTVLIFIIAFYLIKILRDFSKTSSAVRAISEDLKDKIEGVSGVLLILYSVLEKVIEAFSKKKK